MNSFVSKAQIPYLNVHLEFHNTSIQITPIESFLYKRCHLGMGKSQEIIYNMVAEVVVPATCDYIIRETKQHRNNFLLDGSIDIIITTGILFTE
jgi:hypothetical protein